MALWILEQKNGVYLVGDTLPAWIPHRGGTVPPTPSCIIAWKSIWRSVGIVDVERVPVAGVSVRGVSFVVGLLFISILVSRSIVWVPVHIVVCTRVLIPIAPIPILRSSLPTNFFLVLLISFKIVHSLFTARPAVVVEGVVQTVVVVNLASSRVPEGREESLRLSVSKFLKMEPVSILIVSAWVRPIPSSAVHLT